MISALERATQGHALYHARRSEYDTGRVVPFRVSPEPFRLNSPQAAEINAIGQDVTCFFQAVDELARREGVVRTLLNTGKPEIFCLDRPSQYLFVRPDLIVTEAGFAICEIETSPFGLALAHILNEAYQAQGNTTLVDIDVLPSYIQRQTPSEGTIVYGRKTDSYEGQIIFLADQVFSGENRHWLAEKADVLINGNPPQQPIYRAFYLGEYLDDPSVRLLIDRSITDLNRTFLPSLTPHLEEKAILALLWDKR